jgi:DNA invertase Pin-like site-specific DNA recombinase
MAPIEGDSRHTENLTEFSTSVAPRLNLSRGIPKTLEFGIGVGADPPQSKGAIMSRPKRVALYARVSTDGQTTENQRRELRAAVERNGWTIASEYIDHGISGANGRKDRPEFDDLLRAVARKEFDVVAAWSVDRLGRSLQDLVGFLSDLQSKKIDLYLHQQALDTSTPSGKAMFGMLGVFAEFERSIIQERVKAGLARARAKGKSLGRPRADAVIEQRIRELAAQGMGKVKIAKTLGVGVSLTQCILA